MEHRFPILASRPDANHIISREETLYHLLDGRARNPDGTLRQHAAPLYERMRAKQLAEKASDADAGPRRVGQGHRHARDLA